MNTILLVFLVAPLFDWHGKAKNLNNWKQDLNNRVKDLNAKYRNCESDRLRQFSRITRMNSEIYDYLNTIEKVFESNIKQSEDEIRNFEKVFEVEKQKYKLLKNEILKADEVIADLEKILENSKDVNIVLHEVATTIS